MTRYNPYVYHGQSSAPYGGGQMGYNGVSHHAGGYGFGNYGSPGPKPPAYPHQAVSEAYTGSNRLQVDTFGTSCRCDPEPSYMPGYASGSFRGGGSHGHVGLTGGGYVPAFPAYSTGAALGGLFGYGLGGNTFPPAFDIVLEPGDVTLDQYEPERPTLLFVHAGGTFVGVFEDGTSVDDTDPYPLRSLWATATTTDVTFRGPNLPDGPIDKLFPQLASVWVNSKIPASPEPGRDEDNEVLGTYLLFQNFGGDHFAPNLQSINAKAKATVEAVFDNNQQEDISGENLGVFGAGFMKSLRSIRITSLDENVNVALSNDGGNDFMPNLRTISLHAKGFASISISASVNTTPLPDNTLSNGFMRSLKSIHVVAKEAEADISMSYSGGADFMESLTSVYMKGSGTSEIATLGAQEGISLSFSVSPDFEGTESVEFMRSLKTITALSPNGEATLSISASGDILFMPSLQRIFMKGTKHEGEASMSISHDVLVEDEDVAAFMPSLKSITLIGENAGASFSISVETEASYFLSLRHINVQGDSNSHLNIRNGAADDFAPSVTSLDTKMTKLRDVFSQASDPKAEIKLENVVREFEFADTPGDNFMSRLKIIELTSIASAELWLENGKFDDDDDFLSLEEIGGMYFLRRLKTIDVEAGLDADLLLHTGGDNAFQSLTTVDVVAQKPGALTPGDIAAILDTGIDDEDRALTEIIMDAEGVANAFTALERIDVKVLGAGPLGLTDEGSISLHLENIDSLGFDVCLETNGEGDIEVQANDTPGLETLELTGESMASVMLTGAQTGFSLLDLTGMAAGSATTADMSGATFGSGFAVRIGSGELDYEAGGVTETFLFTDDMLGTLNFGAFDTGAPAGTGDLLDLSALGVGGLGELTLDDTGPDLLISSDDGDFTGTIVLEGVDNAADVTDNFIFTI